MLRLMPSLARTSSKLLLEDNVDAATEKMKIHIEHCRMAALNYFYTIPQGATPVQTYREKLYKKQ